jgi:N-acyl homoserine lactone hydrolase
MAPMPLTQMPRIERLDLARVELPADHPAAHLGRSIDVHGFLVDHPDGAILVDGGVGFGNPFIDELYQPSRCRLEGLVQRAGLGLHEIVAVINSHLHFDHCGQNPILFDTSTTFYAQAAEFEAVEADHFYTDASWALSPREQRRTVRGDEQIADGVTILATPGHTAGHQSVLIEAAGRRVVIGVQVVWHRDEFDAEVASGANVDPTPELQAAAVESIRRLKSLQPEVVYLSHCAAYGPGEQFSAISRPSGVLGRRAGLASSSHRRTSVQSVVMQHLTTRGASSPHALAEDQSR